MFKYFIGDRDLIDREILNIAKQHDLDVKFSRNVLYDLNNTDNLFFIQYLYYFLYDKDLFSDKKASQVLIERLNNSRNIFIMVGEESVKQLSKYTTTFKATTEDFMTLERLATLRDSEIISAYYKIYFKNPQYQQLFGEMINEVLTGHLTAQQSLKILIYKLA